MTTQQLLEVLCAQVAIEDHAARELAALLDSASSAASTASDSASTAADLLDDEDEASEWEWKAVELDTLADQLSQWAQDLRAALMAPPDQREAIR